MLWSRFQRTGTDNYSIKYGESCLRKHEQYAALATLDTEIQTGYSQSDKGWDGEYPKSILADRASHINPPTHHIAGRHQIRQDTKLNWQGQQHTSPTRRTGSDCVWKKAIKARVRIRTNLRSGEMYLNDTPPYQRAFSSDTTTHMLGESITSPRWLHMHRETVDEAHLRESSSLSPCNLALSSRVVRICPAACCRSSLSWTPCLESY